MTSAANSGGTNNYVYNALGQLIEKSGAAGTTLIVYDEVGHIIGEYTSTGVLIEETVWMGDIPVATLRPDPVSGIDIYYVHSDHLGTVSKITRPSDNSLMWRWDPDTFGSAGPNTNPSGLGTFTYNLRYPGQYALTETGLYNNYFRDYDPQTGRYLESDPIGLRAGVNTYAYVDGNPVSNIDPLGLQTFPGTASGGAYWFQFGEGAGAMWRNYQRMQERSWRGSDLYYHCMANCQATNYGEGGAGAACTVSHVRTNIWGRLTEPDWLDDYIANKAGQAGGMCASTCSQLVPQSSPGRPPFPGW
jgi:RHS repeat-associated protein